MEQAGIRTVSVSLLREITEKMNVPRALFVPFKHGYPLGENIETQNRVLNKMLDIGLSNEEKQGCIIDL